MSSEKPNFLSQPIVKNVFMFRNGDPYYEARRVVINHKRISNFETLLREVTGGIQAPFGAVRNIYTPIGGHKVDCLESLKSGEQYVAAGREKFKRLDYQQIGLRRKRMMHTLPMQAKPVPQNRIIVSARFLKPIKEPCPIFVVANGDVLDPAARLLIHQKMLGQFDKILEMVTEKMGLKVLGGVRSLYTYEGHQVTDGNQLESGQLYVAVGRERFKKLPYSDLLFTKPRGARRVNGMKAHSLPPIYRFSKQNGNSKSVVRSSDSGDGDSKNSPPRRIGSNKEHLSSFVREISQARLISLRKKRSGQSMTFSISDNADLESKADDRITEDKTPQDQLAEETTADDGTKAGEGNSKKAGEEEEEAAPKNTTEEDISTGKEEKEENQETHYVKERGEEKEENDERNDEKDGDATAGSEEKEEEVEEEVKEEVTDESQEENGSIEKKEEVKEEVMEEVTDESKEEKGSIEKKEEAEEEVMEEVTDESKEEKGSIERKEEAEEEVMEEVTDESKEELTDEEQGSKEKEEELKKEAKGEVINESKEELTDDEQGSREKEEELKKEAKGEVINESKEEVKKHEQGSRSSNSDKTQDSKDKEDGTHPSSEHEKDEQDKNTEEERVDKESGKGQKSSKDQVNDEGEGKKQKEMENSNDPGKPQSDNETRENDSRSSSSSSSNSNQEEDVSETKEGHIKEAGERERKIN